MSTVMPDVTSIDMPVKTENVTFLVYADHKVIKNEDGTTSTETSLKHTSFEKEITKLKTTSPDLCLFEQTVSVPRAGTIDGLLEIVPDKDEALQIINRGISAKFNQKIKTTLCEQDEKGNPVFQPVDGVWDAKALLQEPTQRKSLSDYDRAMKAIAGLDPATLAALMNSLAAAAAQSGASE